MFLAIYNDGCVVKKQTLESAFALPGKFYVFEIGTGLQINDKDGVMHFNKNKKQCAFKIGSLELIDIEKVNSNVHPLCLSIYHHDSGRVKKVYSKSYSVDIALGSAVKIMHEASRFCDWESYESVSKLAEYKSEIDKLTEEIRALKNQIDELKKL